MAGDALFTARNDEPNWAKAHPVLRPAFGQEAMHGYFDRMLDIGLQMADKWARLPPGETIDVPGDMTKLTLDVIALCGFDYRLNAAKAPRCTDPQARESANAGAAARRY